MTSPLAPKTKTWFVYQRDDTASDRCTLRPLRGSFQQGQWRSSPAGLRLTEQVLELCFDQTFTVELAAAQMGVAPQVLHDVIAEQAPLTVTLAVLLTRAIPEIEAAPWISCKRSMIADKPQF